MEMEDSSVRCAELALGAVQFDARTNRSVLGSLNQMKFMLDARVAEVEDVMLLNPLSVSRWLCHYPVNIKGKKTFLMADKEMMEHVEKL